MGRLGLVALACVVVACGPSGETKKKAMCMSTTEFACADGTCIDSHLICNGNDNCTGGEDEKNCTKQCAADQYQCSDGKCIARTKVCDMHADCSSREDEKGCGGTGSGSGAACATGMITCGDGTCYASAKKC